MHRRLSRIIKESQEKKMAEFTLLIDGMHCGSCIRRVTQALNSVEGVEVKEVRLGAARLIPAPGTDPTKAAVDALAKVGYNARLEQ
jgi:copper chaperone